MGLRAVARAGIACSLFVMIKIANHHIFEIIFVSA